jgi:hypothetical protein
MRWASTAGDTNAHRQSHHAELCKHSVAIGHGWSGRRGMPIERGDAAWRFTVWPIQSHRQFRLIAALRVVVFGRECRQGGVFQPCSRQRVEHWREPKPGKRRAALRIGFVCDGVECGVVGAFNNNVDRTQR